MQEAEVQVMTRPAHWAEQLVPFVRMEGLKGVSEMALLVVWSAAEKQAEIVKGIERAVTKWVATTKEGMDAWQGSSEDLNIGDLIGEGVLTSGSLVPMLRDEGVEVVEAILCNGSDSTRYDKVLVNTSDAEFVRAAGYEAAWTN